MGESDVEELLINSPPLGNTGEHREHYNSTELKCWQGGIQNQLLCSVGGHYNSGEIKIPDGQRDKGMEVCIIIQWN